MTHSSSDPPRESKTSKSPISVAFNTRIAPFFCFNIIFCVSKLISSDNGFNNRTENQFENKKFAENPNFRIRPNIPTSFSWPLVTRIGSPTNSAILKGDWSAWIPYISSPIELLLVTVGYNWPLLSDLSSNNLWAE